MRKAPNSAHAKARGFTLVELAIALAVIAILSTSVLMAVRVQTTQRQTSDTRLALDEARSALLAYAAVNGKLPCPAQGGAPGKGQELARVAGRCPAIRGLLPWESLGITAIDGWGRRLAYVVTNDFAEDDLLRLDTPGSIQIAAGGASPAQLASDGAVAAAVWSFGSNGSFGTNTDGSQIPPDSSTGADEQTNGSLTGQIVVARDLAEDPGSANGVFDDQVIWISRFVLVGRLIEAGRLP
ncbi:type II secretion system GspH family protein [Niveibacterium sp. 24ML]|uniref:type II secretion system protein n=1 Tax=Niveibacterium sp. 24ML TaxID=2985512 RepID=UPI0022717642|nr:type II secretion system protein [Niveibacterium sp. 24ML]MCX9154836.1 type II secretion system GspH family protein [Niveibacterium sp. 24ML]